MSFWITILRLLGVTMLLGLLGNAVLFFTQSGFDKTSNYALAIVIDNLPLLALSGLCFGGASALSALQRIDKQITQAMNRRRIGAQSKDVAPIAPNWSSPLDPPRVEVTPGLKPQRRIDRVKKAE